MAPDDVLHGKLCRNPWATRDPADTTSETELKPKPFSLLHRVIYFGIPLWRAEDIVTVRFRGAALW